MNIIDTHAHYDHSRFGPYPNILNDLKNNDIQAIVNVGTNTKSIKSTLELCKKYDFIHPVIGYFPCDVIVLETDDLLFVELENLCKANNVRGIGEIGLDYHWDKPSRDLQKKWFRRQIELAIKLNLPICVHSRDAKEDTMEILKDYPECSGVIHCYSYDAKTAMELYNMGYYFGIGGTSTYSNAIETREVIKTIPLEKLVVETDAPYLTPSLWRGKINRSDYLVQVVENIAKIKELSVNIVESSLIKSAKKLYNI